MATKRVCDRCGAEINPFNSVTYHTANGRTVKPMLDDCKWMQDEFCVNADCPACADYCPVANYPGVCRFEERGDDDAPES